MARRPESAAEYLFNEARYALRDIRQKLFEEAWFGRPVTDARAREHDLSPDRASRDFDTAWGRSTGADTERSREREAPELDR